MREAISQMREVHFLISWRLFSPLPFAYLFSEVFDLKPTSEKKGTGEQVLPANHANEREWDTNDLQGKRNMGTRILAF